MNTTNKETPHSQSQEPPLYIRKATGKDRIDMDRVYDNDLEYIVNYLNDAYHIDWEKMKRLPFGHLLMAYYARIAFYPPFVQVLLSTLMAEETKMIMYAGGKLSNKLKKKKKQESLRRDTGIFIDFCQKMEIKRSLLEFAIWQYKYENG